MLSFGSLRGPGSGHFTPVWVDGAGAIEEKEKLASPPVLQECGYYDVEQVQRIAHALLVTLGTACVEKTSGDLFSRAEAVVPDIKKEMLEYLSNQSDAYASGSGVVSSHGMGQAASPTKVLDDMFEGFVRTKRTLFTRVSSKILYSEKKGDKIDEFIQELDRTGMWMVGRREVLAKALLKRVDRSKTYHCEMKFDIVDELANHKMVCVLRPVTCDNPGCGDVFSAIHAEEHDAACIFKLLSCEQKCKAMVARGDMDKHCVTMCPMKLVNCPFQQVGCITAMPQGLVEKHCTDYLGQHLLQVLNVVQKQELSAGGQAQRILLLEKAMSVAQRSEAVDIGSLLLAFKEQESRVKSLEQEVKKLRQDLKATDVSAEVLQLRRELRSVQKQNITP